MSEGLEGVDQVRAARLTLAAIDGDQDHMDAVFRDCAADPYGDGVVRLVEALAAQNAQLADMATGGQASRFFLDVLHAGTSDDVGGGDGA